MICSNCKQETPEAKFCAHCGKPLAQPTCPHCSQPIQTSMRFCQSCGGALNLLAPPQAAEAQPKQLGNIGMLKGNLDLSTHIGSQTHINGPVCGGVTIQMGPTPPTPQEQVARGENLLSVGQYAEAAEALRAAVSQDPASPRPGVLLALALLRGRNPAVLPKPVVQQVTPLLVAALAHESTCALAAIILGVIQQDYYLANGMDEGEPPFEQVRRVANVAALSKNDRQLLRHLNYSRMAKAELNIQI